MSNPVAKKAKKITSSVSGAEQWGEVQKLWNTRMTPTEKGTLLVKYSGLSTAQANLAVPLPWSALSAHVRKSLKKYFRSKQESHELFPESAKKPNKKKAKTEVSPT